MTQQQLFIRNKIKKSTILNRIYKISKILGATLLSIKEITILLVKQFYPNIDFRLMFSTPNEIGKLFPFKDKLIPENR